MDFDIEKINERARSEMMTEMMRVRMSKKLKDDFQKACKQYGLEASEVIRALMTEYIQKANNS